MAWWPKSFVWSKGSALVRMLDCEPGRGGRAMPIEFDKVPAEEDGERGPLRVLMAASEAVPFAKTGGLADVTSALSTALATLGHDVTLVLPRYRQVGDAGRSIGRRRVTLGAHSYDVEVFEAGLEGGVRVLLVGCAELYDRDGLYGDGGRDHPDNDVRFGVLVRSTLDLAADVSHRPDVVHAHDWQAALAPVWMAHGETGRPGARAVASVLTIHNLSYQGVFSAGCLETLGLGGAPEVATAMAHRRGVSLLKGGIVFADAVTTVSRQYAKEIVSPELGRGLDGALRERPGGVAGILNGIDVTAWNPGTDRFLPAPFSPDALEGKGMAKRAVLERYGMAVDAATLARPLVGMVSRMVPQKGLDLLAEIAEMLPTLRATFVALGTGLPEYENLWRSMAVRHPGCIGARIGFDEELAHLIEAGADMFLMPSRFEPCGLNKLYSLRYGTVPVVRATGGLADTVEPFDPETGEGTGFVFTEYSGRALLGALREALRAFQDRPAWRRLQVRGMSRDHSWDVSAREYVKVYKTAVRGAGHRAARPGGKMASGGAQAPAEPV